MCIIYIEYNNILIYIYLYICSSKPSGQAIHVPQISAWNYGGISGDHPRGNFLIISLHKFRRNEGEFFMLIFPLFSLEIHQGYFRIEISLIFPSKFQSVMKGDTKGLSCEKISQ